MTSASAGALFIGTPSGRGSSIGRLGISGGWLRAYHFFQVLIVTSLAVVIGGDSEFHALSGPVPMLSGGAAALHWW